MPEQILDGFQQVVAGWQYHTLDECQYWYALHTRSNFERRVAFDLASKGVEYFLPLFQEVHQWKDRKMVVDVPLFRGYVFTRFADCNQSRLTLLRIPGVVRILGHGEQIEPIPDVEMSSIQQLLASKVPFRLHPFLREGAWVRVKTGPLKGLEGRLLRVKSDARLVVSISLLSQSVSAEIDTADITLVRPADRQV